MLLKRTVVGLLLGCAALIFTYLGGFVYVAFISAFLAMTAWEYSNLLNALNLKVFPVLVIAGVLIITLGRAFPTWFLFPNSLVLIIFCFAITYLRQYENGSENAAASFGASLSAVIYVGWLGSYLISLRFLDHGMWWMFLVLPLVWLADTGAYLVGTRWGKHSLSARLSPNKTWEGYAGGVLFAVVGGALLAAAYNLWLPSISPQTGALLGLLLSLTIPLGDLTESLFKRQAGVKDSGGIFPGHGGVFDRLDTILWAVPISYLLIIYLFPIL